jgi:hypothetical protein
LYLIFFIPLATEPPKGSRARRDVTMPSWLTSHAVYARLLAQLRALLASRTTSSHGSSPKPGNV